MDWQVLQGLYKFMCSYYLWFVAFAHSSIPNLCWSSGRWLTNLVLIQACRNVWGVRLVPVNLHSRSWSWWKATGNTAKG